MQPYFYNNNQSYNEYNSITDISQFPQPLQPVYYAHVPRALNDNQQPSAVYYPAQQQFPSYPQLVPVYRPPHQTDLKEHEEEHITSDEIKSYVNQAVDDHATSHILGACGGTVIGVAASVSFFVLGFLIPAMMPLFLVLGIVASPIIGLGTGTLMSLAYDAASDIVGIECEQFSQMTTKDFHKFIQDSPERTELIRTGQFPLLAQAFSAEQLIKKQEKKNQEEIRKIENETSTKIEELIKKSEIQIKAHQKQHSVGMQTHKNYLSSLNQRITETVKHS